MAGEKIHVLEELSLSGGSLDGKFIPHDGFVTRGGREMENHFECLWDLFRSIPSLEVEDASVLDEFTGWTTMIQIRLTVGSSTIAANEQQMMENLPCLRQHKRIDPIIYDFRRSIDREKIEDVLAMNSLNPIFGYTGVRCSPLKNGIRRLKCAAMCCVLCTISMACLILLR